MSTGRVDARVGSGRVESDQDFCKLRRVESGGVENSRDLFSSAGKFMRFDTNLSV